MNPELKVEWVQALRSGEYNQAKSQLRVVEHGDDHPWEAYCCLGVLGNLLVKRGEATWQGTALYSADGLVALGNTTLEAAAAERCDLARFTDEIGREDFRDCTNVQDELASMNDRGETFAKIADVIVERL